MKKWQLTFLLVEKIHFHFHRRKFSTFCHHFQWPQCCTCSMLFTIRLPRYICTFYTCRHIVSLVYIKDESFHTKLASHYIGQVLKLYAEDNTSQRLKEARERLLMFLEESQYYHAPVLLSQVHDTELYRECALLYGRVSCNVELTVIEIFKLPLFQMEEHEKALTLLAHKLKDFQQAEKYCCFHSQVCYMDSSILATHRVILCTSPGQEQTLQAKLISNAFGSVSTTKRQRS